MFNSAYYKHKVVPIVQYIRTDLSTAVDVLLRKQTTDKTLPDFTITLSQF